ncbi:GNAT family N-acetyltransferase [Aquibacillus koreensis]|uniref:GNAT family N-acetyltransferase n=1 Tax=Aquibacillus koreensis TaxID=279446 RepID=A0A9X3WP50_9BACI|nr:GNAT family N-acetyltransferase [Aquibacillus koreensis]MCT2534943.1 GNAT family N-acetyltransferase [Aquibacillus koreensis]MDC3422163.1 GNAT family N-acetyltransferase [Aquibacillus koreensis]
MLRKAMQSDIDDIMAMVKSSTNIMNERGNFQWDETYPLQSHYQSDLDQGDLYVYQQDGEVVGATAISEQEHSEYPTISWSLPDQAITIKRLVVDPNARGKGIPDALFTHAEEVARQKGIFYIKTDTFSNNPAAQKLFSRMNYQFVEKRYVEEKKDSLLYFEKKLRTMHA